MPPKLKPFYFNGRCDKIATACKKKQKKTNKKNQVVYSEEKVLSRGCRGAPIPFPLKWGDWMPSFTLTTTETCWLINKNTQPSKRSLPLILTHSLRFNTAFKKHLQTKKTESLLTKHGWKSELGNAAQLQIHWLNLIPTSSKHEFPSVVNSAYRVHTVCVCVNGNITRSQAHKQQTKCY